LSTPPAAPQPSNSRSDNPLRPARLDDMIGQDRLKKLLRELIRSTLIRRTVLDHVLLVGPAGVGKTTVANVLANELEVDCYPIEAPVAHDTLLELREVMFDNDILFIDEIHQQAIMERRGRQSSTQPEVLYHVLEDRKLITDRGILDFPAITVIGATTDEGMLPDAFVSRFPLPLTLDRYTQDDLMRIAKANGQVLEIDISWEAARVFARASRSVPRTINNYVRNGAALGGQIDVPLATRVVGELHRTTDDGLTLDMVRMLVFLYRRAKRTNGDGETTYQASVSTIATAIGKSRDTKAIQLRVEPFLIEKGYVQVGHGGRSLTAAGVTRAKELSRAGAA
jgi:Holliday junction DNA helicase RuvB